MSVIGKGGNLINLDDCPYVELTLHAFDKVEPEDAAKTIKAIALKQPFKTWSDKLLGFPNLWGGSWFNLTQNTLSGFSLCTLSKTLIEPHPTT